MQGKEYNQHKRKQTLPERMFATTGASQARSPITMGATQRFAAVMFVFVFLASGVYFLHPFSIDNSYAETATSSASAEMSVNLDPTITIWTTDTSDSPITAANIAASPDESVATTAVRAHVSTNNLTGYTLTIQSNSTDAKMKHENTSVTKTIDPITGSGTSSSTWAGNSSLNNMWGYSIGTNDSFVGVPGSASSATTIDSTDTPNNDNSTDIAFATKADLSLPAGTYRDTVIFSATANYVQPVTMQSFTSSDCTRLDTWSDSSDDITLRDTRDGNSYVIRKLADGHCWMVQNLRLINKAISSSDSDASGSFTIPASSTSSSDWCITSSSACDDKALAQYNNNTTYGAYYNWYTATAGSGTYETSSGNAIYSICPKGWKLPTGGSSGQFQTLYTAYSSNVSNFQAATLTGSGYWAGRVDNGTLTNAGSSGYWWSRTANNANRAYRLYTYSDNVLPQSYNYKYGGFSVRCILSAE